jgi:hypothetical protein
MRKIREVIGVFFRARRGHVSDSVPRVVVEVAIAFTENAILVPVAAQEV